MLELIEIFFPKHKPHLVTQPLWKIVVSFLLTVFLGLVMLFLVLACIMTILDENVNWFGRTIAGLMGIFILWLSTVFFKMYFYELKTLIKLKAVGAITLGKIKDVRLVTQKIKGGTVKKYYFEVLFPVEGEGQKIITQESGHWVYSSDKNAERIKKGEDLAIIFNPENPIQCRLIWNPPADADFVGKIETIEEVF